MDKLLFSKVNLSCFFSNFFSHVDLLSLLYFSVLAFYFNKVH